MKSIVHIQKNDLVVSIQDMADFSGNDYRSIRDLMRKNEVSFGKLGLSLPKELRFKSVLLNEPQATFLITLMKNTKIVTGFKLSLVMEFYRMRELLCEVNRFQLETAHKEIRTLQLNKRKTYKEGFMALSKYKEKNNIPLTIETMFDILSKYDIVENRDVTVSKKFLTDDSFGRQNGDSVIEFNSRSLDLIFRDYVYIEPTLF